MNKPATAGTLVVLSGPSGVGKGTICKRLLEHERVEFSVSATTRKPRPGELDGRDYYFLSRETFERDIANHRFLEHAQVHGNLYGTPRQPVEQAIAKGRICLLDIDVEGARQVRQSGIEALFIFLMPPNVEELERRITRRASEAPDEVARRLRVARIEMEQQDQYDHVVVNDDLDRAVERIVQLVGVDGMA